MTTTHLLYLHGFSFIALFGQSPANGGPCGAAPPGRHLLVPAAAALAPGRDGAGGAGHRILAPGAPWRSSALRWAALRQLGGATRRLPQRDAQPRGGPGPRPGATSASKPAGTTRPSVSTFCPNTSASCRRWMRGPPTLLRASSGPSLPAGRRSAGLARDGGPLPAGRAAFARRRRPCPERTSPSTWSPSRASCGRLTAATAHPEGAGGSLRCVPASGRSRSG